MMVNIQTEDQVYPELLAAVEKMCQEWIHKLKVESTTLYRKAILLF